MTNYTIAITSDTVCPWCYVGHKRLQRAIAAHKARHPSDTFTTKWAPYYLNPAAPGRGASIDKQQYYAAKFGGAQAQAIFARLRAAGAGEGIDFSFGGRTGATRDSHRVIALARQRGGEEAQVRVVEALFRAYFEEEADITDWGVLERAGAEAGIGDGVVRGWLEGEGDQGGAEVDEEVKRAQGEGMSGVPHFVIQDRFEVSGAQEPAAFLQVFEKVKSKM